MINRSKSNNKGKNREVKRSIIVVRKKENKHPKMNIGQALDAVRLLQQLKCFSKNSINIPGRSEKIVYADSNNIEGLCEGKELDEGLYLGNCITEGKNNKCIVSIINLNEKTVIIEKTEN